MCWINPTEPGSHLACLSGQFPQTLIGRIRLQFYGSTAVRHHCRSEIPLGLEDSQSCSCLRGNRCLSVTAHVPTTSCSKGTFQDNQQPLGGRVVVWPNIIQRRRANADCLRRLSELEGTWSRRDEWNSLLALLLLRTHLCLANRPKILVEAAAVDNIICSLKCAPLLLPHRSIERRFHLKCRVTARLQLREVLLLSNQSSWQPGN